MTVIKLRCRTLASTVAPLALVCGLASPAFAQGVQGSTTVAPVSGDTAEAPEDVPEIVVTGTRIARPEIESPSPIVAVTAEQIQNSGNQTVADVLLRNPALVGSQGTTLSSGLRTDLGLGETGVNLLNLRNLGVERTLVLVNGRRHVAGIPDSAAVDINSIPEDLIDRVDILTGGASAVYGADGVSGVVNFVLKRNFEGVKLRAQNGISSRGDGASQFFSATAGKNFSDGRGNVALSYEYSKQKRIDSRARSYLGNPFKFNVLTRDPNDFPDNPNVPDRVLLNDLRWADSAVDGAVDLDLDGIPDFTGSGLPYDRGRLLPGSGGRTQGGSSTEIAGYYGDIVPKTEKHSVNLLGSYEFSDSARLFFEGKYVQVKAFSISQPSYDFYTYLAPDNYYLIQRFGPAAAPDGALLSRDNFDLGQRGERNKRETIRGVLGLDGKISDHARYEVSYVYGQTKSRVVSTNNRIKDRYFAALDAVVDPTTGQATCRINLPGETLIDPNNYAGISINGETESGVPYSFAPGQCVPLNLLGNGVASRAAIDFISVDAVSTSKVQQNVLSGSINGDFGQFFELPGGPIAFAIGGEYRKEQSQFDSDPFLANGNLLDSSRVSPSGGKFHVKEVFGELNAPLLKDRPFADLLSVGAAIRLSDYSSVGKTTAWKFEGIYAPVRDIRFRGSLSKSVRAPNIGELYSPLTGTNLFISDPCDRTNTDSGTQYRAANCATILAGLGLTPEQIANFSPTTDAEASTSRPGYTSGNSDLQSEKAKTWTAGVVLQPRFAPRLTITFDWYDIKIRGAINTATAQELTELCVDQPTVDNVYCPNVTRDPTTGFVTGYTVRPENVAKFATSGLDATLSYNLSLGPKLGDVSMSLVGGYLRKLEFVPTLGADVDNDRREAYAPRWQATADLDYKIGAVSLGYTLSWFEKTRRFTTEQLQGNPDITDPKYFFYKAKWEHNVRAAVTVQEKFTLYGGINNLTDQKPDYSLDYPISALGRYFFAGVRVKTGPVF